ncbi:MAG TPA: glycosyltransferase family 39 protein [Candidatus Binatia bacterium]
MTISRALWIAAIAGGLALRLYLVLQPPLVTPDSLTRYEPIARNLAAGHGFSRAAAPPYAPDGFNQPGYPLFLAAIYLAAGEDRRAVVLAQFGLELLTVFLILQLARRAGLKPPARAAVGALALLCPVLPMIARAIWTESLATTALTAAVLAWVVAFGGGGRASWTLAGACSAACLLIRSDMAPVVVLLVVLAAALSLSRSCFGRFTLAVVALAVVLAPWIARNAVELGGLRPLSNPRLLTGSYTTWLDTWVDDLSQLEPYWWHVVETAPPAAFPPDKVIDPGERARAEAALAQARAAHTLGVDPVPQIFAELTAKARRERPFRTFVLVPFRRVVSTWTNVAGYAQNPWARAAWISFLLSALAGACWGLRHKTDITLLLLATILGRSLLPLRFGIGVEPRYVVEALPAAFLFAGFLLQAGRFGSAMPKEEPSPPS